MRNRALYSMMFAFTVVLFACLVWWHSRTVQAQDTATSAATFTKIDISGAGTGANQGTVAVGINATGDITGFYLDMNSALHGFIRAANGTMTAPIDAPGAGIGRLQGTLVRGIDTAGDIAGFYIDTNNKFHGFLRNANGSFTTIDAPGASASSRLGTEVTGLDSAGNIAGFYADSATTRHGFLLPANGIMTTFDVPGAGTGGDTGTVPLSIGMGNITGFYEDASFGSHGFVRTSNGTITAPVDVSGAATSNCSMTHFSFLGGTVPLNIDTAGDITGFYSDTSCAHHAFVRSANGTITTFDAPGAGTGRIQGTFPLSTDTAGNITGAYADASGVFHGFTRAANGTITAPIDAPGAATSAPSVLVGTGNGSINAAGQIAGSYTDASGVLHGFLLSPAPPDFQLSVSPSSLTIVAGQSGTATFTVTPENGFNSQVTFTCSGLPSQSTCNFNPPSVTPNGSAVNSTLTIATTAPSAVIRLPIIPFQTPLYAVLFTCMTLIVVIAAYRKQPARKLQLCGFGIILMMLLGVISCGGGGGGGGSGSKNPGTPSGTSTVSVLASTSGGAITHTATLSVTITH